MRGWGPVTKGLKQMSHARIQDLCWGGGGGGGEGWSRAKCQKTALTTFFFYQLFISEEITFQRYQRGSIIFPGGSTIFQGGPTFSSVCVCGGGGSKCYFE